jgi:predicted PurR-regulated permease PerM
MTRSDQRLEQNLGRVAMVLLLLGCLVVIRPFSSVLLWSVVLCFSSWPIYQKLLKSVGNRRTIAALAMTLGLVLVMLMPFLIVGGKLGSNVKELAAATRTWLDEGPPAPPGWLERVPGIGKWASDYWQGLSGDSTKLFEESKRFIEPASAWLLKASLAMGRGVLEMGLSILVTFFLFRDGQAIAERMQAGAHRLGGEQGRHLLEVAGKTVRGVVYGILGTALVQAVTAGVGFIIAGVPGAILLALLTFFLSVVPMGPPLVWLPAALYLFHHGSTGWGVFMLIWGLGVSSVDNVVKPWLISQGSDMPFLLILFGVLGGAMAFGFIGVFLGPTLLAVGFRLVEEWASAAPAKAPDPTQLQG